MLSHVKSFFARHIDEPTGSHPEHALQIATAALLIEISRADAEVARAEENAILKAIQEVFALNEAETAELIALAEDRVDHAVSFFEFTQLIDTHFSQQEKVRLVELLWRVAHSDSRIDHYEEHYIRKIADLLHVSHGDFIRMKHRAADT